MITEARQYATFELAAGLFSGDVGQVREVLEISRISKVSTAPSYRRGMVNVRSHTTPIVDLRLRFGLPPGKDCVQTRLGVVADSVPEVIEREPAQIQPPPRIARRASADFIQGMGKRGDDFIIILDVDALFSCHELALLTDRVQEPVLVH